MNNIAKALQAETIEEKKFNYYKLKNALDALPDKVKKAEMEYYEEGGCNLNDPADTKRCGLEYYLEIKREERIKALESFSNYENKNEEEAEEMSSFGIFDNLNLTNLFNKNIEGMVTCANDANNSCSNCLFDDKDCIEDTTISDGTTYISPCKYDEQLKILIDDLDFYQQLQENMGNVKKMNRTNRELHKQSLSYMDKQINEYKRKGKVDFRNASFYDNQGESYRNVIEIMKTLYWIVFAVLVFIFIYRKYYEIDSYGYVVIVSFTLIPLLLLKPFVQFIMLNMKRYNFLDTLYFTIALITLMTASFLYFITSK